MGRRRRARQFAVQMLYQVESGGCGPREVVASFRPSEVILETEGDRPPAAEDIAESERYASDIVHGVVEEGERIDALIRENAVNWRLERLAACDRAILRVAVWELLRAPDVPPAVVLDEAIELAKRFGSDKSASFVNGVLDAIVRRSDLPAGV